MNKSDKINSTSNGVDTKAALERINHLKKTIDHYRHAYHVLDKSLISDEALDSLKKELFDLEARFPDLVTPDSPTQRVGGVPLTGFKKVRHISKMYSLHDAFDERDLFGWFGRIENYLRRPLRVGER